MNAPKLCPRCSSDECPSTWVEFQEGNPTAYLYISNNLHAVGQGT